jgi:hypothetical protein
LFFLLYDNKYVSDLSLFDVGDDSLTNSFEERDDDAIQITPKYLLEVPIRPITRSRVKKLKYTFNEIIQSILVKMNFNEATTSTSDDQIILNIIYV